MQAKRIRKIIEDARKAGIIITGFKNGLFQATNNTAYTRVELLLSVYGEFPNNFYHNKIGNE